MADIKGIELSDGSRVGFEDTNAREDIDKLSSEIDDLNNDIFTEEKPINKFDSNAVKYIYITNTGKEAALTTQVTTDFIPVASGDVIYLYASSTGSNMSVSTFTWLNYYDSSKEFVSQSKQFVMPPVTINDGISYIRATVNKNYVGKCVLTIGKEKLPQPVNISDYPYFEKQKVGKISALENDLEKLKKSYDSLKVESMPKVIECWGDSRTESMVRRRTSYPDYLQKLLGTDYGIENYGTSSQCAGMVSARFGSNNVYVTIDGNKILASGKTQISGWKTSNYVNGKDFREYSNELYAGVMCNIGGVNGIVVRGTGSNSFFQRLSDGIEVTIKPNEKITCNEKHNLKNACILWAGKNDMSLMGSDIFDTITKNVMSMADNVGHNYFIVLGETYTVSNDYLAGTNYRNVVDSINQKYAEKYSSNYIDIQAELISKGLSLQGITATDKDNENISKGFIPDSLMDDTVHPNEKGREAIAKIIYEWMKDKGWV